MQNGAKNMVRMDHSPYCIINLTCVQGDIMSISVLGTNIVILNSLDTAVEMLDTKGAIYSDRRLTPMMKLSGWGGLLTFSSTEKRFRQHRGLIHKLLGTSSALSKFTSLIEDENRAFLRHVLEAPEDLADHVRQYVCLSNLSVYFLMMTDSDVGSLILKIIYGYRPQERNDPFIDLTEKYIRELTLAASPATWIVDYLPFCEVFFCFFVHFKRFL
jgi:hypothetical protein